MSAPSGEKPIPLARFRADPARVRVTVRRFAGSETWVVTVHSAGTKISCLGTTPRKALALALRAAERRGYPGIDLGMDRVYLHPHGVDGIRARRPE